METYEELGQIEFNCPSKEEITKNISAVAITNPITNVEFAKNNSMYDTRMGAFRNVKCGTCKGNIHVCPGHHGHIPLTEPCLNPQYLKTTMKKILSLYCFGCFKKTCTCIEEPPPKKKRKKQSNTNFSRIKMISLSDNSIKHICGRKISFKWEKNNDEHITIQALYMLISQIPKNIYILDFPHLSHLSNLSEAVFIHDLLVLPTVSRPPNMSDGVWRSDNITRMYNMIVKKNVTFNMKRCLVPKHLVVEFHNQLQSSIDILFDVKNTNLKLRQNVTQNGGLRQRIDGKEGRLRMNLMGKRVEFSARTVLSGDPNLGINEVGVPKSIADNLTVPVLINRYNLEKIKSYKLKYIFKKDGRKFDTNVSSNYIIDIGDTVERCLINGDIVAVNRQPTLHRGSIVACYVKIFQCSTFRLNYSTMITLNADCDGDEVNVHVPQDLASRAELETLMLASCNIVCSQSNVPLIGCTQDSLLGCYKLSCGMLSEHDFMEILYAIGLDNDFDNPCIISGKNRLYSGNRVLTQVLTFLDVKMKRYEPNDKFLMIDNWVIKGHMNKAIVGTSDNSIIHHIYLSKGHIAAGKFIHLMQLAASTYLDIIGFSVGISDCIVDHDEINFQGLENHLEEQFFINNGKWNNNDENTLCDALLELTKLPAPDNISVKGNRLLDMITSGSKGSMMNFNQITRCLGQQIESEGRISNRFGSGIRTMPHHTSYDMSATSKGLVKNSFFSGLNPREFFMHSIAGRIGLIDTSIKTSSTGSQYRRLVKSLEPLIIKDMGDGERTVVNSTNGNIIQFSYGENSFDGTFLKMKR